MNAIEKYIEVLFLLLCYYYFPFVSVSESMAIQVSTFDGSFLARLQNSEKKNGLKVKALS